VLGAIRAWLRGRWWVYRQLLALITLSLPSDAALLILLTVLSNACLDPISPQMLRSLRFIALSKELLSPQR